MDRLRAVHGVHLFVGIGVGDSACSAVPCAIGVGAATILPLRVPNGSAYEECLMLSFEF